MAPKKISPKSKKFLMSLSSRAKNTITICTWMLKNLLKGELEIRPMLNEKEFPILYGKKLQNSGDVLCLKNFYPHSNYKDDSMEQVIYKELFLNGPKIIGQSFTLTSTNTDYLNQEFNFQITGTYENNKLEPSNVCYISMSDFDKIAKDYSTMSGENDENGNIIYIPNPYKYLMLQVDSYQNIDEVLQNLTTKGFSYDYAVTTNDQFIALLIYIPIFISIIVIIISLNITYSFLRKKNTYNQKTYGILKSLGFTNFMIYKLELLENIIIFLISFLISLVIYLFGCWFIQTNLLIEFVYNNYALKIPWVYLVIFLFIFIFLIKLIETYLITKTLNNNSIKNLLKK